MLAAFVLQILLHFFSFLLMTMGLADEISEVAVLYFKLMNVGGVYTFACSKRENERLGMFLSNSFVPSSSWDTISFNKTKVYQQLGNDDRVGIIVDLNCTSVTELLLEQATRDKFFGHRKIWILALPYKISEMDLRLFFEAAKPAMFNITEYFLMEYEGMKHRERMEEINKHLNEKVLKEIQEEMKAEKINETATEVATPKEITSILQVEAIFDSEVVLCVPDGERHTLYSIHRKTNFSKLEAEKIGRTQRTEQGKLILDAPNILIPTSVRRKDFHRTIMRTGCGLLYYDYYNRSDDISFDKVDTWSVMIFSLIKLSEESLNFRMLIKCFDDYGWPNSEGQFNGLVGFMQRHNAELSSTGLAMLNLRRNVLDYVDGTYEFSLGLIFRQPTLASVTNIFVLPFSDDVWQAVALLVGCGSAILYFLLRLGKMMHNETIQVTFGDVISFFSGAVSQQGHNISIATLSVRITVLVFMISAFFLFTAYSASIVALLQSPSHFINSVESFLDSPMDIGIEDLPYERNFLSEDSHEAVVELRRRKVTPKGEDAYLNTSEGIRRVRQGFFGFQCELSNGYKEIALTYTEAEKCSIKKMDLFPNRILGSAVTKRSPYRDVLATRYLWYREVGFTKRTFNRWSHRKPPCQSKAAGFTSVGIADISPLFIILTYGILVSLFIFAGECFFRPNGLLLWKPSIKTKKVLIGKKINKQKKRQGKPVNIVFIN